MPPKPILVTGSNRSGTTWTGKMIASSDEVFYVEEPFNCQINKKYNLIPCPFTSHYHFVTNTNEEVEIVKNYLNYRIRRFYPWWLHIKTHPNLQNVNQASRLWLKTNYTLIRGLRPLVKDPIAIMSAEWLYKEFDMDVVIIVRSPLAYVSSIKRLGWSMSPGIFLSSHSALHFVICRVICFEAIFAIAKENPQLLLAESRSSMF